MTTSKLPRPPKKKIKFHDIDLDQETPQSILLYFASGKKLWQTNNNY